MLKRGDAATYIGVGVSKFDQLVKDGIMPRPKLLYGRVAWDRAALDAAIDDLPDQDGPPIENPWDRALS